MKNFFYLLVVALSITVTSCDNDDGDAQDLLIGSWKLSQEYANGQLLESNPCNSENIFTFNANGTVEYELYINDENDNCVLFIEQDLNRLWENTGKNIYSFTADGQTNVQEINFSGNTFSVEFSDNFEGLAIDFKNVFTRI